MYTYTFESCFSSINRDPGNHSILSVAIFLIPFYGRRALCLGMCPSVSSQGPKGMHLSMADSHTVTAWPRAECFAKFPSRGVVLFCTCTDKIREWTQARVWWGHLGKQNESLGSYPMTWDSVDTELSVSHTNPCSVLALAWIFCISFSGAYVFCVCSTVL